MKKTIKLSILEGNNYIISSLSIYLLYLYLFSIYVAIIYSTLKFTEIISDHSAWSRLYEIDAYYQLQLIILIVALILFFLSNKYTRITGKIIVNETSFQIHNNKNMLIKTYTFDQIENIVIRPYGKIVYFLSLHKPANYFTTHKEEKTERTYFIAPSKEQTGQLVQLLHRTEIKIQNP